MFDIVMGTLSVIITFLIIFIPRRESELEKAMRTSQPYDDFDLRS